MAGTIDTESFKSEVEEFRKQFADRLAPAVDRIKESIGKIGEFVRGLVGADLAGQITEMFESGVKLKDALLDIVDRGRELGEIIGGLFTKVQTVWNSLPDPLKKILLGAFVVGLVPGGGTAISLTLKIAFKIAGFLLTAASPILKWLALGAGGLITLPGLILAGGIIVLGGLIWKNRPELSKWLTGERQLELSVVIIAAAGEALNKLLGLLGIEGPDIATPVIQSIAETKDELKKAGFIGDIVGGLVGLPLALSQALLPAGDAFFDWAVGVKDDIVGNSIFPDMLDEILNLLTGMPERLLTPLTVMREVIATEMGMIRDQWVLDWLLMAQVAEEALRFQRLAQEAALNRGSSTAGQGVLGSIRAGNNQSQRIDLRLDAKETRRLIEEGNYKAILAMLGGGN